MRYALEQDFFVLLELVNNKLFAVMIWDIDLYILFDRGLSTIVVYLSPGLFSILGPPSPHQLAPWSRPVQVTGRNFICPPLKRVLSVI